MTGEDARRRTSDCCLTLRQTPLLPLTQIHADARRSRGKQSGSSWTAKAGEDESSFAAWTSLSSLDLTVDSLALDAVVAAAAADADVSAHHDDPPAVAPHQVCQASSLRSSRLRKDDAAVAAAAVEVVAGSAASVHFAVKKSSS